MSLPGKPIRAVLFDWDGTLLNSYDADARAYVSMFHALDILWNLDDLCKHYSPNWYRVYRAAGLPRAQWPRADRLWRKAYREECPELLPGVRRMLRELSQQYVLALVTSGNRSRVRRQLRDFGLADKFSVCVCSEDALRRKPDPAPLRVALRRLRLGAEVCVYVGDAPEDMLMARRARVHAVGVLGPSPTRDTVATACPDALLAAIGELPGWLRTKSSRE
jgi:HAD superfamily hydrolase (TIGR01509 family)